MKRLVYVIALVAVGTNAVLSADDAMWKRVQRLDPGTRVKIALEGAAPVERYFVQVNDSELIVLNLSTPDVPKRQLLKMAIDNPAWMADTSKTTYRDNSTRVGPDGVFVKDKKVAELNQVVEWIAWAKVTAIQK
jgi:hypothetical protein